MSRFTIRRTLVIPTVVLCMSMSLTLLVSAYVAQSVQLREQSRFDRSVLQTQQSINERMAVYVSLLRGVAGLFAVNDISAAEFRQYTNRLDIRGNYPGLQGIGFSQKVAPDQLAALTEQIRASGNPMFHIWPDTPRDEYHAVVFLEPEDGRNNAAFGFDMFTEAIRREAMERARDTGRPIASGKVTLVQEIDQSKQVGFLIYLPVYRGGDVPETLAERRSQLLGFVYSPFRVNDLLRNIVAQGTYADPNVAFDIYDGPQASDATLMYRSPRQTNEQYRPAFASTSRISVAGHVWTISFYSQPAFDLNNSFYTVPMTLIIGLLFSIIVFILTKTQTDARQEAEQALHARDTFLSVASHELKTPLTALLGNAELLLRRSRRSASMNDRDQRNIQIIADQSRRISKLIDELLDHSRMQTGRLEIASLRLDLTALTERVTSEFKPTLSANHQFLVELAPEALMVCGDEMRLEQVLFNLLSNAAKYSPNGGEIRLRLTRAGDTAMVQVSDQGIGIPPAAIGNLFAQYYRAPNTKQHQISGMGIGLYVVKEIVERHGGTIDVQSGEGQGSTFTIRLPLDPEYYAETSATAG